MKYLGYWLAALAIGATAAAQSSTNHAQLPLVFEANRGQASGEVRYLARGAGYRFFLNSHEVVLTLRGEARSLRLDLVGSNRDAVVGGRELLPGKSHYLIGNRPENWITNVPQYAGVEYKQVYPGIDLMYHGDIAQTGRLEYDFIVAPGADPGRIVMAYENGARVESRSGDLLLAAQHSTLRQLRPRVFQVVDGEKREIPGRYRTATTAAGKTLVRFELGSYDRGHELVIDPVFIYGTVLPGSGDDNGLAVAADAAGNAYVTGYTTSADFLAASPYQAQLFGGKEVFVSKINAAGNVLMYSTYIGGSCDEEGHGVAVDAAGNAYIAGWTSSIDFPTLLPVQASLLGTRNAFVAALNTTGSALLYSTYLGGSGSDQANAIALDSIGAAYVTGSTNSRNFPAVSAWKASLPGVSNAFVAKLNPSGTALIYSTYLGGSGTDVGNGIAVDAQGQASIVGSTTSADFPTLSAAQPVYGGGGDAFITRFNAAGSALTVSTFYGGAGKEEAYAIALFNGSPAISGFTTSVATFPLVNPLQSPPLAASGFLLRLSSSFGQVTLATIVNDNGRGIAFDSFGNVLLSYFSRVNASGTGIDYSLPLSGTIPHALASDGSGNAIVVGQGATLILPSLASPKDFTDVSLVKVGETSGVRIGALQPASVAAGAGAINVYVTGSGFVPGTTAKWNGLARNSGPQNTTLMNVLLNASDVTTAGLNYITVVTPSGAVSSQAVFTVQNPAATIASLSPSSATAGGAAFTLTVTGTGFVAGSSLSWNGSARTSTILSSTQMTATITAADIAAAGSANVQVRVPAPGGGLSASAAFSIANPAPAVTSLTPSTASTGGADFTLTVQGSNFTSTSVVRWNGSSRATTYVGKAQLRATIAAADIAAEGTSTVSVFTPTPGGGTSADVTFAVSGNPPPVVSSLSPASVTAGSGALTLTLNGSGLIAGSQVQWNGANRTTTFVTATQLTTAINAADVATAGAANLTVINAAPGGGTSPAMVFTINNPTPVVATISPATIAAASSAFTVTVNGSGFVAGSQVKWNGASRTTTYVSATQLTAAIAAADVSSGGTATVTVTNAAPNGGTSNGALFTITSNAVPVLSTIQPVSATAGSSALTLTVTGGGFISSSTVQWNGTNRATTFVSATQLTAVISASDLAGVATASVTVVSPAPGGGTSSSLPFTVAANPAPVVASILPASAGAGSSAQTLTVTGGGFVAASTVKWNGANRVTTYISATQLTAAITAADLAASGTASVTVLNPAPGGGASAGVSFAINNPAPAAAASSAFTLAVTGSGFVASSTVQWNGASRATTYVSATQLTVAIAAADVAAAGTATVTVTNAAPGGGISAGVAFAITANPAPTVASILPASTSVGSAAFTLTLIGSGFVPASTVQWNGASRATTYVSATQLAAAIPAADVAASGTASITIVNPAPGGGTSAAAAFAISNPTPAISAITPATATAGSSAFTLTITGGSFVASSQVQWNGANRTTTFLSAGQLTASISAADVATAGTASVSVLNPTPGGGTSSGMSFAITANPAPSLTSILPTSAINNSGAFTLTVSGSGFIAASQVQWNGSSRVTSFISSTQLTAAITSSDVAAVGTAGITVVNPAPGGGTSSASSFVITANPAPTIISILPSSAGLGSAAFNLTVNGSGFIASSQVSWNGVARATTFLSATQLSAAILASELVSAGTASVNVSTPAPGGGVSSGLNFTITSAPTPSVASILPASASVGSGAFTLLVTGSGFASSALVQWSGANRATTFVSSTQLTAAVLASDVASSGTATITVVNPDGGTSGGVPFVVGNPAPSISTVSPASTVVGASAFSLTVNGAGFVATSTVQWNGANRTTTFVSPTQLAASITAADVVSAGAAAVKVVNPAPGGGTSLAAAFTITANPAPALASILPSAANAGAGALTLTVTGSGFISGSTVQWNGVNRITTYVSSTQLTAAILAADVAVGGSIAVTVVNPAPGGGASSSTTFTVNNPGPTINALTPSSAATGSSTLTVTVTGSGFIAATTAQWNGVNRATTYVNAGQATFSVTSADLASAGTAVVTMVNPGPGGGTSTGVSFAISSNPVPAIASVVPASATAGSSALTLTVNGYGFNSASTVQWNGANRATTLVSSNQLTAALSAADVSAASTAAISVLNPAPGGGTSAGAAFAINNPTPAIIALAPAAATAAGPAFTLTVNGTGFTATSTVQWNGTNRATTFVSGAALTAAITLADIAAAATATVTIVNPAPGGGTSSGASFAINVPVPAITTISPASTTAGATAQTLTINGSGFVTGSQVQLGGSSRATTFGSATLLTAAISAGDLATAGAFGVTVVNSAPGGGTSIAATLTVNNPAPVIASLGPSTATAGAGGVALIVNGSGFVAPGGGSPGSLVQWNGVSRATTFVSASQMTATLSAADLAAAGTGAVAVVNPAPGGGVSAAATFTVTPQDNPVPVIAGISPSTAAVNAAALTVTINGGNFLASSTVHWNGATRASTFLSATQMTVVISASDLSSVGTNIITVVNPTPGGGTSAGASFAVMANPAPSLASIVPASAAVGASGFTLTVTGSGFIAGSQILWNGANRAATLVSPTQMTADIPATDLAAGGTASVTVLNPAPGGGTSTAATFTISNPAPSAASIAPTSASAGASTFTLTVNGSGFVAGTFVLWNGATRPTTVVSATQLTASITAADVAATGTAAVTVSNPAPGGGISSGLPFAITANPAPSLASILPASSNAGASPLTVTVAGSGFVNASQATWNGASRATTYVSVTQLIVAVTAADLAVAGTAVLAIVNPTPGGGTSAGAQFTIVNPAPALSAISPAGVAAGSAALTLTVNGSGFVASSQVQWNGASRATTFVSTSQLTAAITTADLAAAASISVTVTNPTPGGGSSNALPLSVASNPTPTLASILPSTANVGAAAQTVTVTGGGFVPASVVQWNGAARATTYVSATQLTAAVTAADLAIAGAAGVTVSSPSPGGGTSASASFVVSNPQPAIVSLSPASTAAGSPAFSLIVNGSGFVGSSQAQWNGASRATTLVSATQLSVAITASDVGGAGASSLTVVNPAPGGGTSLAIPFTVTANPVPTLASILPVSAVTGASAFTMTLAGSGFTSATAVQWNGASRPTTYISATQVTAAITTGDLAAAGTASVAAVNPAPGGGASAPLPFTIGNPVPVLGSLSPPSAAANSAAFTLTLTGSGFAAGSVVQWNGLNRATIVVSATQLTAQIAAADLTTAGPVAVIVTNPAPGGGSSGSLPFTITANPAPSIASISPTSASINSSAFTLTVSGGGFVAASQVLWNGAGLPTTFVSATALSAAVPASGLTAAGAIDVTVSNPTPGGGLTTSLPFTVTVNPAPSIAAVLPVAANAGSGPLTLTVTGGGFVAGSQVMWNGAARATTVVSSTVLSAAIAAADVAAAGGATVTVSNPAPGGGTSVGVAFAISNPPPAIAAVSPGSATAGSNGMNVNVSGSGFVAASVVMWNGTARLTTYVNSTQLTTAITAADLATAGSAAVSVSTPTPGGGVSTNASFAITGNPKPSLAGLLPATAAIGSGQFTLAVLGTGFTPQSQVQFNGQSRVTTYVSTTEVTAVILASDLSATGSIPVTVTNPAPGGGVSNPPDVFTITGVLNPVPSIGALSPTSATVNGDPFTLTVNGSGFIAGSQVLWNGALRSTTFISTSQLTAAIPASDMASPGSPAVTVANPLPGGGTSNSLALPVTQTCSFVLTPSASAFSAAASGGSVAISAPSNCVWSAASLNTFLTITSAASGSGSGSVSFALPPNSSSPRSGTLVIAGQNVVISQDGAIQGVVSAAPAGVAPGGSARIPVTLVTNGDVTSDKIAFSIQVSPNAAAPALAGTLSFAADAALGAPSSVDTSGGAGLISVTWLGLPSPVGGTVHLGDLTVTPPPGVSVGQSYVVRVSGASASVQSASVSLAAGADATLSVRLDYLIGDGFPSIADSAGNFGDNSINTLDLINALRAITSVPGFVPAPCSDRFDALDAYPADTGTVRGGDGILNTLDLLLVLQRATNVDPARPRRVARGLACSQITAQLLRRVAAGTIEQTADGSVYLHAPHALSLDGLALSLGTSSGGTPAAGTSAAGTLRWIASAVEPSIVDAEIRGTLAVAWMTHIELKAGERLLLGRVAGGSRVQLHGASAHSGKKDVHLSIAGASR